MDSTNLLLHIGVKQLSAQNYTNRVTADGGTIADSTLLNSFISLARSHGYERYLKAVYSPALGIKGSTTCNKLYSVTGQQYDLNPPAVGVAYEPDIIAAGLAGRNTIRTSTTAKALLSGPFAFGQPGGIVGIARQKAWNTNRLLLSAPTLANLELVQSSSYGSPGIYLNCGSIGPTCNEFNFDMFRVFTVFMNGASSQITMDATVRDNVVPPGNNNAQGIYIGYLGLSADAEYAFLCLVNTNDPAVLALIRDDLNSLYSVYGARNRIIFDGDSLTYGCYATPNNNYADKVRVAALAGWDVYNLGSPGYTIDSLVARAAVNVDPLFSPGYKNIVVIAAGTNNLTAGNTGAAIHTTISNYCTARRAAGWKVAVTTIPARQYAGDPGDLETRRGDCNTLIRANYLTYSDALIDIAANASIGPYAQALDATYFFSDHLHMVDGGFAAWAGVAQTALTPLL